MGHGIGQQNFGEDAARTERPVSDRDQAVSETDRAESTAAGKGVVTNVLCAGRKKSAFERSAAAERSRCDDGDPFGQLDLLQKGAGFEGVIAELGQVFRKRYVLKNGAGGKGVRSHLRDAVGQDDFRKRTA